MGAYSFYGDENIDKWVFDDTHAVSVMSVEAGAVIEACREIMNYKKGAGKTKERYKFAYGTDYNYY